jgi:hypothetical protein
MGLFSRPTFVQRTVRQARERPLEAVMAVSTAVISIDIVFSWIGAGYDKAVAAYEWSAKKLEERKAKKAA